jgi:hypothetical protein
MTQDDKDYLVSRVETDGFDYTFIHYSSFEDINDEKFHELREAFLKSREELRKYIGCRE